MRILAVPGTLAVATSLLSPTPAAVAGEPATCAGQMVTIDLSDPGAPDPKRPESDVILGTPEFDVVFAGAGDDVVCGVGEGDSIYLGPGDDLALAGAGSDSVSGGGGTDVIRGGSGDDNIHPDGTTAEDGREEVHAGRGYDVVVATAADELIEAGPGIDAVYYYAVRPGNGGVRIDLAVVGPQDALAGGTDELVGVEQVKGTGRADVLLGDGGDNHIAGGPGADRINGRGGDDRCSGNGGTDTFRSCEEIRDRP